MSSDEVEARPVDHPGSVDEPDAGPVGSEPHPKTQRVEVLGLLRAKTEERAELLEQIGVAGTVEHDIAAEVVSTVAIARPERFELDHEQMMRALEVLDRNGARFPSLQGMWGPFRPISGALIAVVCRWLTKWYLKTFLDRLVKLYGFRAANAPPETDERRMLRRAHWELRSIRADIVASRGISAIVVVGILLGTVSSVLISAVRLAFKSWTVATILVVIIIAVFLVLSWCALTAAATVRRRIKLSVDHSAANLFDTIGACGHPPKDHSVILGIAATVVMLMGWVLVPIGISIGVAGGFR